MPDPAVVCSRVGKIWAAGTERAHEALRAIDLSVDPGEFVALLGPSGCGKSTLLQIVSGILQPTSGRVVTRGRIAALLELGAGFNPEFSGRENVFLNGEIMGLSRAEIEKAMPAIERFSDILRAKHILTTTRRTRGDDIDAACGQLVGRVQSRQKQRLRDIPVDSVHANYAWIVFDFNGRVLDSSTF